ncbi:hypothetical protein [Algoriphagus terrigena]|uniref:hypothetical protein n=1 Tax=Algoriphagus terrigena TaxID=344884 RepID=UPI0004130E6D|nr:hypothetical protein [Algoriphagus terrigena]
MGKDKEREGWEVNRIIDELTNFKKYGFKTKNGFLTAAILSMQEKQDFQAKKVGEILDQIANLIHVLEAERDVVVNYEMPKDKADLHVKLLKAASILANTNIVKNNPANWVEQNEGTLISGEEKAHSKDFKRGKKYRYGWA